MRYFVRVTRRDGNKVVDAVKKELPSQCEALLTILEACEKWEDDIVGVALTSDIDSTLDVPKAEKTTIWEFDEATGSWNCLTCGLSQNLEGPLPEEEELYFCPGCGGEIVPRFPWGGIQKMQASHGAAVHEEVIR